MDEVTKQALNTFAQQMITAAQDGAKWTIEQAPLVVQEWLRWQLAEAVVVLIGLLVLLVVAWRVSAVLIKMKVDSDGDPIPLFGGWVIRILAMIFCGGGVFANTLVVVKVLVSPRVVVLEKFMELVK